MRRLTRKLELVMRASGMGMSDHQIGETGPVFDASMMSIYGLEREPGLVPMADWEALVHPEDLPRVRE